MIDWWQWNKKTQIPAFFIYFKQNTTPPNPLNKGEQNTQIQIQEYKIPRLLEDDGQLSFIIWT